MPAGRDWVFKPHPNFGDGKRVQMFWKTDPGDWSMKTSCSEFRCYCQHGQVTMFHRMETGSNRRETGLATSPLVFSCSVREPLGIMAQGVLWSR